jgi:hypothetical protein
MAALINAYCDLRTMPAGDWGQIFLQLKERHDPYALEARRCIMYQFQKHHLVGTITIAMSKQAIAIVDKTQKEIIGG